MSSEAGKVELPSGLWAVCRVLDDGRQFFTRSIYGERILTYDARGDAVSTFKPDGGVDVPVDLIAAAKAEAIMELVEYFSLSGPCLDGEADEFLNARGYKTLAEQLAGKGVEG